MARTNSNDLNKTRYTRRDYESIKNDLINAIPSLTQEWTSREEADPGIVLIKLMAMFGDTLSYNVDKIALELYISTVTQRKNCDKILKLLGYKMHWYRSARVMAHVRLIVNQDAEGNLGHMILKPYQTQFTAGNLRYTVVQQSTGSGDIDIYSDTLSTAIQLVEGTPVTVGFDKSVLVNNRYYFGNYNLDESEIVLTIDNVANSRVTCKLTENLYLVSSNTIIYYEFGIDEYDRPYIELCEGWEDIAGTDTATFTVTYILSSGSLGNISDNAFSNIYDYESENISPSNLVINNLSNLTNYGENGEDLESYNSPGYDPQSVASARIDSAKYVFTHDTLVTSSDYEKACKRANDDITVSKLVDAQVVINDQLNLDSICSRALDRFSKIYVTEDSLSNPGTIETKAYLLPYLVILYLAYKNFDPKYNFYFKNLSTDSIWCLRRQEDSDETANPYSRYFWEVPQEFTGNGSDTTFELSGPKNSTFRNQVIDTVKVTINGGEPLESGYTYNQDTDIVTFDSAPEINDQIVITKIYEEKQQFIQLSTPYPKSVTSLFINGQQVSNYNYDESLGKITLINSNYDNVSSIIVNGIPLTNPESQIGSTTILLDSPGYYPYKPTENVLLSVRDLLSTLKVLTVDVDFGTLKLFPFQVEGTVHLMETVAPAEALQIIEIINEALVEAYYPDLHPIGEKPDFIEIVDVIQNSDPRIKYFDAIGNIVKWAPEVNKRIDDFNEIFDTTSAIMYDGLSDNFNLSERFMRFKFKNTAVLLDSVEEEILQTEGTEYGTYNIPNDYGTAYLVNYSRVAGKEHIVRVLPNTYITLNLKNTQELQALVDDLSFRGFEMIKYIRTLGNTVTEPETSLNGVETFENVMSITVVDNTIENYSLNEISSTISRDNLAVTVSRNQENVTNIVSSIDDTEDILTIKQVYTTTVPQSPENPYSINTGIYSAIIEDVLIDEDSVEYVQGDDDLVTVTLPENSEGKTLSVIYYLCIGDVINIDYNYYRYTINIEPGYIINKIIYPYTKLYRLTVDKEYYADDFSSFTSGEINSVNNSELFNNFNNLVEISSAPTSFIFDLSQQETSKTNLCIKVNQYTDEIDSGQDLEPGESYVYKYTLINNTGMQWIKED